MEKLKKVWEEQNKEKLKTWKLQGRAVEEEKSDHESEEEEDPDAKEVFDKDGFYDVPKEFEGELNEEDEGLFSKKGASEG